MLEHAGAIHHGLCWQLGQVHGEQLSRGLCLTCSSSFEAAAFLVLHVGKGRERTTSFNRVFTPLNEECDCEVLFHKDSGWSSGGSLPSLFPELLQCTLGRNSSWSRSCPSLTVSGCMYLHKSLLGQYFPVCTASICLAFLFPFCPPLLDSVCERGGQLVLQGFDTELLQWDFFDRQEIKS